MDDLTAQVSQQATLMLGTIHDAALKSVMSCLEYQFDTGEFLSMPIFCSIRHGLLYIWTELLYLNCPHEAALLTLIMSHKLIQYFQSFKIIPF